MQHHPLEAGGALHVPLLGTGKDAMAPEMAVLGKRLGPVVSLRAQPDDEKRSEVVVQVTDRHSPS